MNLKYTKEILEPLVKQSVSMRQLLGLLQLKIDCGGNYKHLNKKLIEFNLDTSHWTKQSWSKGKTQSTDKRLIRKFSEKEIFKENSLISTKVVKNYLEGESIFIHQCSICKNTKWLEKEIPLELDHINGNNRDNRKENLRFLCPNCHAQTESYCGKNINRRGIKISDEELFLALNESTTIRKALIKVGLTPKGGNYERVYKMINDRNIKHLKS